jgi:hypothetical protein
MGWAWRDPTGFAVAALTATSDFAGGFDGARCGSLAAFIGPTR